MSGMSKMSTALFSLLFMNTLLLVYHHGYVFVVSVVQNPVQGVAFFGRPYFNASLRTAVVIFLSEAYEILPFL